MSDFFAMGGYAFYVWSSYALAALLLVGMLVISLRVYRARQRALDAYESTRPRRARRADPAAKAGGAGQAT